MDHVAGPLHILLVRRKEDLVQYNMSQTLFIWENYLVVFVCLGIYLGIYLAICHEICLDGNFFKKFTISRIFHQTHHLEVGLTKSLGDHETLSIVRHVGLPVNFSSMKSFVGFRLSRSCVKRIWNGLHPFDQWELLNGNGHGPSVLCVKWPLIRQIAKAMTRSTRSDLCDDACVSRSIHIDMFQ